MEMIRDALSGMITGIVLLGLIVLIFRREEDKRRQNKDQ
jgi:hypothetical protein